MNPTVAYGCRTHTAPTVAYVVRSAPYRQKFPNLVLSSVRYFSWQLCVNHPSSSLSGVCILPVSHQKIYDRKRRGKVVSVPTDLDICVLIYSSSEYCLDKFRVAQLWAKAC